MHNEEPGNMDKHGIASAVTLLPTAMGGGCLYTMRVTTKKCYGMVFPLYTGIILITR